MATPAAFAETVPLTLTLSPSSPTVNRLELTLTAEPFSDNATSNLSGTQDIELEIDFDPGTHAAGVTGITFVEATPGTILASDVGFSMSGGFITVNAVGLKATIRTPSPPGAVLVDQFSTLDHEFVFNDGTVDYDVLGTTGMVSLAADPQSGTTDATGTLTVSAPDIVGDLATYDVTVSVPIDVSLPLFDDPVVVTLDAVGTIEGTGQFTRVVPEPTSLGLLLSLVPLGLLVVCARGRRRGCSG
jgi:hypothetical protein